MTSQSIVVKLILSGITISTFTFGGLALAQVNLPSPDADSFEMYRAIRTAEAAVTGSNSIPKAESTILVATAFDAADDYIREIFGTPVPTQVTAAEAVVRQPLKSPLPEGVDNGKAPVPSSTPEIAYSGGAIPSAVSSRALLWPMRGGNVSSRFGMRWGRLHQGTDIAAPYGTSILAAADGKVVFSGWEGGYGNLVIVDHENGVKTKYGHCSKLLVSLGERIQQGDILGKVGNTGHSTGPHLHYEVIREGQAANPEHFTRRR